MFTSEKIGGTQVFNSSLSPSTKSLVSNSQKALGQLSKSIAKAPQARLEDIKAQRNRQLREETRSINKDTQQTLAKTRAAISKRFGRSDNSTFGNQYVAEVEGHRVNALRQARVNADALAEDQITSDQNARIQRLNVFQNLLNNVYNQAQGVNKQQANTLIQEGRLENQRALARARMIQQNSNRSNSFRLGLLSQVASPIAGGLGTFLSNSLFSKR